MKFSLQNLKIRDQVLVLTLPLMAVLLATVALLSYNLWKVSRINLSVDNSQMAAVRTETLLRGVSQMSSSVQSYILTQRPSYLDEFQGAWNSVLRDFAALHSAELGSRKVASQVETLQQRVLDWKGNSLDPVIKEAKAGHGSSAAALLVKSSGKLGEIQKNLAEFLNANQNTAAAGRESSQQMLNATLVTGLFLAACFALLLLVLVRVLSHRVSQPILQLIQASDRLRQGHFDPPLPVATENEFGALSKSFLHMTESLRRDREELGAIKHFSEAITQCTSENEVYDHVLHACRDRFHPRQVIIFKLRPDEDFLEVVASLNPLPESVRPWPVIEGKNNCKAVRMGRALCVNDVSVEPLCPGKFALPEEGSYYCGPLIAGGIIIGAVRLEGESGFWTPERESLLESYLGTCASVLSNLQLLQTMREQANIDPLTGLYNRRFCKDYARKLMAMARRKNTPLGFIMLDLDHFKDINDVYGHEVGDRVLKQFAKTVTQSMRETNLTARLGGEEFVVLLPDTGSNACQVVAERIRAAVSRMNMPQAKGKLLPPITVSLGIAVYPEHGGTLEEMLHASDRALYESKRAGRNRTTLYVEETQFSG